MRFRTVALALALGCGLTTMADAAKPKQRPAVRHPKTVKPRKAKSAKAHNAKARKVKPRKAPKVRNRRRTA
jgi:hypothetical protein